MYGWVCPRCGSIYGPQQPECYRCNGGTEYTVTATWKGDNSGRSDGKHSSTSKDIL